ncbi:MAG: CopD family protein [Saprospiraceae bacterium]|nr:CopD family protein [Candidatus Brachybacter algidus]
MFLYLKALHIIFIVTWFAGLFYIVRLLIYNTEANDEIETAKAVLQKQYSIMIYRLWYIITWPSAILTLFLGPTVMYMGGYFTDFGQFTWLHVKLGFVILLYIYHFTIHKLVVDQKKGIFKYSSNQFRIWNEVATILLFAIVFLASVKQSLSFVWGILGLVAFIVVLMSAVKIYKHYRG